MILLLSLTSISTAAKYAFPLNFLATSVNYSLASVLSGVSSVNKKYPGTALC